MSGAAFRPRRPAPASYIQPGLGAPHAFADRPAPPPRDLWRPQQVHGAAVMCADLVDPTAPTDLSASAGSGDSSAPPASAISAGPVYPVDPTAQSASTGVVAPSAPVVPSDSSVPTVSASQVDRVDPTAPSVLAGMGAPTAPSVSAAPTAPAMPRADAAWTRAPGRAVGVVTADCVPVLLRAGAPEAPPLAVAAVHAGWRGLAAGVLERALFALRTACPGAPLHAAHGPAAGACCYEVDGPVCEALEARYPDALPAAATPSRPGHVMLDLARLARAALCAAGAQCLPCAAHCTICNPRFASYRRDGARAGRMLHWIRLAEMRED